MIRLRLWPMGSKNHRSYRIVAADSRSPVKGKYLETVGIYDPVANPRVVKLNKSRTKFWLNRGALPSDTVRDILRANEVIDADGKVIEDLEEGPIDSLSQAYLKLLKRSDWKQERFPRKVDDFAKAMSTFTRRLMEISEDDEEALEALNREADAWIADYAHEVHSG